jgi:integrase
LLSPHDPVTLTGLELPIRRDLLAITCGITDKNPCRKVAPFPENNKRIRYLLDEEKSRLFEVLVDKRAHLRDIVTVAIGTGMRRGDQLNLRWEKVDFQRGVIYVPNSKTGNDYSVPMNEDVRTALLRRRRESKGSEFVFVNPDTKEAPRRNQESVLDRLPFSQYPQSALARSAAHVRDQAGGSWFQRGDDC